MFKITYLDLRPTNICRVPSCKEFQNKDELISFIKNIRGECEKVGINPELIRIVNILNDETDISESLYEELHIYGK